MNKPLHNYQELYQNYSNEYNKLKSQYNLVSGIRLVLAILFFYFLYQSFNTKEIIYVVGSVITFISFVVLMKIHGKIAWKKNLKKELININKNEIDYLKRERIVFDEGTQYIDPNHFNTFDLDIFGKNSLYQNLNRTATYMGRNKLAEKLMNLHEVDEIKQNQEAIKELSTKLKWRQQLFALANMTQDRQENYQKLIHWANSHQQKTTTFSRVLFLITPLLFTSMIIAYLSTQQYIFIRYAIALFIINLGITATQIKKIKREIEGGDKIHEIIQSYGLIIEQIEKEDFKSEKLMAIKKELQVGSSIASQQIKKLSVLFYNLDNIHNIMGALLFNGTILYHIHTLHQLLNWKTKQAQHIEKWLDIVGEIEALNSFANFSYNNSSFIFPDLNDEYIIELKDIGHPLIDSEKRVCNDVSFKEHSFMILTGSNMSGKSTFLRTLGINMVLAGIGAPICSSKANLHPLNVIVSMRQTDSLSDGESYFFAEVKRLKKIMDKIETEICFVLLDEVLKGTNSDDKQTGTIEVIKKMIAKKALGCIATHDLEVCQTTYAYPNQLMNKCFEVEIINNELSFDYKLRNGICKNKSATFLMKKLNVI